VRQGEISRLAFQVLGREGAISFLNSHNAILGERPLALATGSVSGCKSVEDELSRLRELQVERL
jgi:hypothetical protein